MSDTVLYEQDGHIVTITYHRPERMNAINGPMREALNAAWLRFRDDVDAWVAILTGAGRAFCAGADVREGGSAGTFAGTFWEKPTINSFESGLELFKPTIAAINGPCLGYGMTAVSFCDFVIASERATFGVEGGSPRRVDDGSPTAGDTPMPVGPTGRARHEGGGSTLPHHVVGGGGALRRDHAAGGREYC